MKQTDEEQIEKEAKVKNPLLNYLPQNSQEMVDLALKCKDWATMHGACMRSKINFSRDQLQYAPFAMLPSPFPRDLFEKACRLQPLINELMFSVAINDEFLLKTLERLVDVDPFLARLLRIYRTVLSEGVGQDIFLGLIRSDYMIEKSQNGEYKLSMVEVNTIAAGFGWMGPVSGMIHKFVLSELDADEHIPKLPVNNALEAITDGMHEAWMHYQSSYKAPSSVIMIIVEDVSYNICDQRFHEFELAKKNPKVRTIRRTLTQVGEQGWLDNSDSKSRLKIGETEVAVIYFRCGYAPEQYPTEKEWEARLLIERSLAIKCPSIRCHLAGSKKIQQILSKEGMIDTFLQSQTEDKESNEKSKKRKDDILALCDTFTGLYSLDLDEEGDRNAAMGIANPLLYVLKPQREGGGNNIYGEDVAKELTKLGRTKERESFILMKLIKPPIIDNFINRPGHGDQIRLEPTICELGIFGAYIGHII
ncbi:glutathione synthetase-like isoform X2 [Artemia franciscana]|uniref:glutathione synthetase-like isoform X2 n=1 Tax=Artemia franciscana TaxID=6661 RepID=UPI0032DB1F24